MGEVVSEEATRRVILFTLLGGTWGIDFRDIQEVFELGETTPVPKTPSFIKGIINQRGKIITVIDFALLMGEGEDKNRDAKVVHLRSERGNIGLRIGSKIVMESLPEQLIEMGRVVKKSRQTDTIILERNIVRKDNMEINLVEGHKIIELLESYPFKAGASRKT